MQLTRSQERADGGSTEERPEGEFADWFDQAKVRYEDRAREKVQQRADRAKEELGRRTFERLEEYFPEQARARRRQNGARAFLVGVAVGILLRHLAGRAGR